MSNRCQCGFCKAEEQLPEADFKVWVDILIEGAKWSGKTLPLRFPADAGSSMWSEVWREFDRRMATKAGTR